VEKEINRYFEQIITDAIQVEVHPSVAAIFEEDNRGSLSRMEEIYNKKIVLKSSNDIKHEEIKIKNIDINPLVC